MSVEKTTNSFIYHFHPKPSSLNIWWFFFNTDLIFGPVFRKSHSFSMSVLRKDFKFAKLYSPNYLLFIVWTPCHFKHKEIFLALESLSIQHKFVWPTSYSDPYVTGLLFTCTSKCQFKITHYLLLNIQY